MLQDTQTDDQATQQVVTEEVESGLRIAIGAVFLAGLRRRDPGATVNALLALVGTYLPYIVETRYSAEFCPWQRLYVETAMLTHAIGMLGPYDDIWWWDHLTHFHSATILGGFIHVVTHRHDRDSRLHILGGVFVLGILWELGEYITHIVSRRIGLEPVLVSYGKVDTLLDFVFNLLGAFFVIAFGDHFLGNLSHSNESAFHR